MPQAQELVVLIDDEPDIVESLEGLMQELFAGSTPEILRATSSLEALEAVDEALRTDRRTLVLSDFRLGGRLDGLQILDEARRAKPTAFLVLLSAFPRESLAGRPEFGVIDAFLPKPFTVEELAAVVGRFRGLAHAV